MNRLPEALLIGSVALSISGVYLKYGIDMSLIFSGGYLGVIAFSMAAKRAN